MQVYTEQTNKNSRRISFEDFVKLFDGQLNKIGDFGGLEGLLLSKGEFFVCVPGESYGYVILERVTKIEDGSFETANGRKGKISDNYFIRIIKNRKCELYEGDNIGKPHCTNELYALLCTYFSFGHCDSEEKGPRY